MTLPERAKAAWQEDQAGRAAVEEERRASIAAKRQLRAHDHAAAILELPVGTRAGTAGDDWPITVSVDGLLFEACLSGHPEHSAGMNLRLVDTCPRCGDMATRLSATGYAWVHSLAYLGAVLDVTRFDRHVTAEGTCDGETITPHRGPAPEEPHYVVIDVGRCETAAALAEALNRHAARGYEVDSTVSGLMVMARDYTGPRDCDPLEPF